MDEVFEKVGRETLLEISLGGFTFTLSNTLFCVWVVMALLVILSIVFTRKLDERPGRVQAVLEMLLDFVRGMCRENIGAKHYAKYVCYIGTLTLFVCVSNLLSVINFIPGLDLYSPTKDINVTAPLAAMTIILVLGSSIRYQGLVGTGKALLKPMAIMFPFKVLEYVTKPLSLCLRLFGNVVAAFIIMELVFYNFGLLAAPFSAYFDFFDGLLQGYIFVFLTCIYLGEAVETEE
jgi:F-type H+-transporting ATPase subunit a